MKKVLFAVTAVLLATFLLSVACTRATPPATAQTITGEFMYFSVPLEYGAETAVAPIAATAVSIWTPQGPQTLQLTANTTYSLNGKTCSLEDIGKVVVDGNTTYNCSAIIDNCAPAGVVTKYLDLETIKGGYFPLAQ